MGCAMVIRRQQSRQNGRRGGSHRQPQGCRPLPPDPRSGHQFALLSRARPENRSSARSHGSTGPYRGAVHAHDPLRQHLIKVAVAERESQIPADAQDDDLVGEVSSGTGWPSLAPFRALPKPVGPLCNTPQGEPPHDGQELERHKGEAVGCTLSAWVRR